jgi:hypothetical protein
MDGAVFLYAALYYLSCMKILGYFEKAWIVAAAASIIVMLYNLITLRTFDNRVYFPLFCSMFCVLIWYNIRGQRRFREKVFGKDGEKKNDGNKPPQ